MAEISPPIDQTQDTCSDTEGSCSANDIILALSFETRLQRDGIGGHAKRAAVPLGIAEMFGLSVVCTPEIFYNGHNFKAGPNAVSSELFGCKPDGSVWERSPKMVGVETLTSLPIVPITLSNITSVVYDHRRAGTSAVLQLSPYYVARFQDWSLRSYMLPFSAIWLRQQYHAVARPHRLASEWGLWETAPQEDELLYKVAVAWRTHSHMGMGGFLKASGVHFKDFVASVLHQLTSLTPQNSRILFVVNMKEIREEQETAILDIASLMEIYPQAKLLHCEELEVGVGNPDLVARDIAAMATADIFIPSGWSQFSYLASALQKSNGLHIIHPAQYEFMYYKVTSQVANRSPLPALQKHPYLGYKTLPNTVVVGKDMRLPGISKKHKKQNHDWLVEYIRNGGRPADRSDGRKPPHEWLDATTREELLRVLGQAADTPEMIEKERQFWAHWKVKSAAIRVQKLAKRKRIKEEQGLPPSLPLPEILQSRLWGRERAETVQGV